MAKCALVEYEFNEVEIKLAYMSIISEEIDRLSEMTTNILNLSKVENQGIITDKEKINVSEQIRNCVLLLERKWTDKNIELDDLTRKKDINKSKKYVNVNYDANNKLTIVEF